MTMNALVDAVRPTGGIGVVGVFVPEDPGAPDELAKQGQIAFDFGTFWFKGQTMGTGQCQRQAVQPPAARPDPPRQGEAVVVVSHEPPLDRGAGGLRALRQPDEGWTKVVLHPANG